MLVANGQCSNTFNEGQCHQTSSNMSNLELIYFLPYCKFHPSPALESKSTILDWDKEDNTDKTLDSNKPDVILLDNQERKLQLLEVGVPSPSSPKSTVSIKMAKYQRKQIWKHDQVILSPVLVSGTRIISNSLVTT